MSKGDGAAVDVDLLAIPLKQLTDGQRRTAKASLASIRSTSSSVQPARCSAAAGAHRADAHHRRVDPGDR